MLGPTMLRVVGQQCCVRLHGPLVRGVGSSFLTMLTAVVHLYMQ